MDQASSISVSIRVRPLTVKETGKLREETNVQQSLFQTAGSLSVAASTASTSLSQYRSGGVLRRILNVVDDRVLVFDPDSPLLAHQKQLLGPAVKKVKDIRFVFDGYSRVYDENATQQDVYDGSAAALIDSAFAGYNATVFAYGATGCGKTHTISGNSDQPGIIFKLMEGVFNRIEAMREETTVELSVSYLEIYNETIRDLLVENSSKPLNLREADNRVMVPGLSEHSPQTAADVVALIEQGNLCRATNHTEANATSSRSHAVLSVNLKMKPRTADISESYSLATLSIIDLAGSERASVTMNKGARLTEGANINRSLLALGNCINALCDPRARGHVPYRDSKLTRLLKHSLSGNCKTQLIVCVSPSSQHYDETHNTLQYANRAKEIKTRVTRNVISVDRHVSQYVKIIYELRQELASRKKDDSIREGKAVANERRERDAAMSEATSALQRISSAHAESVAKSVQAATAKAELDSLEQLRPIILRWQRDVFGVGEGLTRSDNISQCRQLVEDLIAGLIAHGQRLLLEAKQADNTQSMFDANVSMAQRRLRHPDAISHFDQNIKILNLQKQCASARAREAGRQQACVAQARALHILSEVRLRMHAEDPQHIENVESASLQVFQSLAADVSLPSLSQSSGPIRILPAIGLIPKQSTTSALLGKSQHRSPRKAARSGGMLKAQATGSPRKKKSVIWKDEAGEGWELEEDSPAKPDSAESASTGDADVSSPEPLAVSRAAPAIVPRLSRTPFALLDAENMPPPAIPDGRSKISNRMSAGFLGKRTTAPSSRSPFLSIIPDAEGSPASSTSALPLAPLTSNPLAAKGLASIDAANTSSASSTNMSFETSSVQHTRSSMLKAAHAKRVSTAGHRRSSIGPMRSAKKSRRVSYLAASPNSSPKASPADSHNSVSVAARAPGRASNIHAGRPSITGSAAWR